MEIHAARKEQIPEIVRLIMTAMTDECCLYYVGDGQTLDDFRRVMTQLVSADRSQYSHRNALVATDADGKVMGVSVAYDGADLRQLRQAFIDAARQHFGRDFSGIDDETQPGELYLDSLAVFPQYRGRGVATALLKATIAKARQMQLPAAGLLVDTGNPGAERLYKSVGFEYINDSTWGGHPMRHLQYRFEKHKD